MKFNKPSFWDFKKPNILAKILLPFTIPIIIADAGQKLFNRKNIKTISEKARDGKIVKTPASIKIYKILQKLNYKVAKYQKNILVKKLVL